MAQHKPTHRLGAFAVVRNRDGRALISRRTDNGYWNLPGGGVEPDETVAEGLLREIMEETGLTCTLGRLVGVYSKPQKREIVLVFEAFAGDDTPLPTPEADEHHWVDASELDAYPLLPKHRERLLDAFLDEKTTIVKDQRTPSVPSLKPEPPGK
ncbi:MAG: 8-oxo-dGTP diphosphatase MutT [Herpetosiphon sp.]